MAENSKTNKTESFKTDFTNPTTPAIITPSDQTIDAANIVVYLDTNSTDTNWDTYQVYSTASQTWTDTTDTNATGFNFTLTQNTNNTLWIRGKDLAGNTGANASTWVLEDSTAPALITLTATDRPNDSGRTVTLSWSAPSDGSGSGVANYTIYVSKSEITDVSSMTVENTTTGTSLNVTTCYDSGGSTHDLLVDGTTYYFAVVATDNAGNSNNTVIDTSAIPYEDLTISLVSGWNLISAPFIPNSTNITQVVDEVSSNLNIVWYYDANSDSWTFYDGTSGLTDTLTTVSYTLLTLPTNLTV